MPARFATTWATPCRHQGREWIAGNAHAAAFLDGYPVSEGHSLIVPRRHIGSIFELGGEEQAGVWNLVAEVRDRLKQRFEMVQIWSDYLDKLATGSN